MLAEALRSILSQTLQAFEIVVVNDGGIDVKSVLAPLGEGRKVVYVRHDSNKGSAAARNTGLVAASGEYIAYLDDDDIFFPDHLETLVTFLEASDCKVAYTDAYRATQQRVDGNYVTATRDAPYSYDFDYDRILIGNFVPLVCFMHERSCLDRVGCFDETLPALEDWDFWIRVSRYYEIVHCRKVTCEFRWREDLSTVTNCRRGDSFRVTKSIYSKYRCHAASKPLVLLGQLLNLEFLRMYHFVPWAHGAGARNIPRRMFFNIGDRTRSGF